VPRRLSLPLAAPALLAAAAVVLAAGVTPGCRDGDGPPAGDAAEPGAAAGRGQPACAEGALEARRYVLCTAGDDPGQGLVVAVHGRNSSADDMRATTALERPAATAGLAVVYPEARDGGWGDDTFATPDRPSGDEDVAFLDELVATLQEDPRIADGPVGVVGFSNGASMAMRYGAARPETVGAVVAVAGQLPRDPAVRPSGPVPLLLVYGTADPLRPYATGIPRPASPRRAGQPTPTLSTPDSVAAFVAAGGGRPTHDGPVASDADPGDGTRLETERWSDAGATLAVLHRVVDGGHTWPSALTPPPDGYGAVSRDLDASAEAVAFVVDQAGPG
jgi:polyhydroxybutyrate depolymerase